MRSIEEWIVLSTAHIAFPPDRKPVAEEIRASYEDHRDALIEAGESSDRAAYLALQAMGDPDEAGELLAKVHKPWLGWAWKVSRWVLGILIIAFLWGFGAGISGYSMLPEYFMHGAAAPWLEEEIPQDGKWAILKSGTCAKSATAGDYIITVERARIMNYTEYDDPFCVVLLRLDSPWILKMPRAFPSMLQARDDKGVLYQAAAYIPAQERAEDAPCIIYDGDAKNTLGHHWGCWILRNIPADLECLELFYDHGGVRFSLPIDFTGVAL